MPNQTYKPEQIVNLLQKIEVEIANGKTTPQVSREAGITKQTYYRWRKEVGGLKLDVLAVPGNNPAFQARQCPSPLCLLDGRNYRGAGPPEEFLPEGHQEPAAGRPSDIDVLFKQELLNAEQPSPLKNLSAKYPFQQPISAPSGTLGDH